MVENYFRKIMFVVNERLRAEKEYTSG